MKNYQDSQFGLQLGKAVKKLREDKKMSQEELRELANLSSGYVSRLEAGEYSSPSISHVFKLAQALNMTLRDLLEYANLIPMESTFSSCLRGEGASEEQIKQIIKMKDYVLHSTKET
jgi:transcriptional regulator with XRE-family HTH domain